MALDIYRAGQLIGSIIRASGGTVHVYDAAGLPVGTFGSMDAATTALERRAAA
jgi:serine phosphatase RsbU (regulator of sigma subunit)